MYSHRGRIWLPDPLTDHPLNHGLVGCWDGLTNDPFVGGSIARDITLYRNHGTLVNGVTWQLGPYGGYGWRFDGTDDSITIDSTFGLSNTDVTISVFVHLDSTPASGAFVKVGNDAVLGDGFAIGVGFLIFDIPGTDLIVLFDGVRWIRPNAVIGTGWHHAVLVIDGSGVPTVYLDGASLGSFSGTNATVPSSAVTQIGGYTGPGGANRYVNATIAYPRIYNRALSAAEVAALYLQQLQGSPDLYKRIASIKYKSFDEPSFDESIIGGMLRAGQTFLPGIKAGSSYLSGIKKGTTYLPGFKKGGISQCH